MALPKGYKNLTVTLELKAEVEERTALLLRDLLNNAEGTLLSDNMSLYDFDPKERVVSVVIE